MSLILAIIFFAWFTTAIVRGYFAHQGTFYTFKDHPVQYTIMLLAILGFGLFCLNRFLNDIGIHLF